VVLGADANPALGIRDPGRPAREQSSLGTARRRGDEVGVVGIGACSDG